MDGHDAIMMMTMMTTDYLNAIASNVSTSKNRGSYRAPGQDPAQAKTDARDLPVRVVAFERIEGSHSRQHRSDAQGLL